MRVVHTTVPFDATKRTEARDHAVRLVEQSRQEPGVVTFDASIPVLDDFVLRFVECYEDAAAHEAHRSTDHYRRFTKALSTFVRDDIETTIFEVADVSSATFDAASVDPGE